jgi:RNA polymerase sigma factor (sigma-70 family)
MSRAPDDAYARYGRALLRKAERILQSRDDAEDMVHGFFTDLLDSPSSQATLDLPYLYRSITNRCLTFLRDSKNRARLLETHDQALRGTIRTRCDDRAIDMDLLLKLTQALDEPTLEILVCRFFDDMTQEEIAEHLGVSRKTVGKKLDDIRDEVSRLGGGVET